MLFRVESRGPHHFVIQPSKRGTNQEVKLKGSVAVKVLPNHKQYIDQRRVFYTRQSKEWFDELFVKYGKGPMKADDYKEGIGNYGG